MPELPEVETIKNDLIEHIQNKKILDVFISSKAKINKSKKFFSDFLVKNKIKKLDRIGKLLIFDFNKKYFLLIHLKMTGQLIFIKNNKIIGGGHSEKKVNFDLPNSSTRIIITFEDNSKLFFNDTRRFGYFKLVTRQELEKEKCKFGIEPLQTNFIFSDFKKLFENKKTNLKAFLLNQKNIAGLGNIYVDESCFDAGISPDRKVNTISDIEKKRLYNSIQKIIKKACKYRGTTFNDYLDSDGNKGNFSRLLKVYGRKGKKCVQCNNVLKTKKIAGRTTVFCLKCQK